MKYVVVFSFSIDVEARDEEGAEEEACKVWDDIVPRPVDMAVEVEEVDDMDTPGNTTGKYMYEVVRCTEFREWVVKAFGSDRVDLEQDPYSDDVPVAIGSNEYIRLVE